MSYLYRALHSGAAQVRFRDKCIEIHSNSDGTREALILGVPFRTQNKKKKKNGVLSTYARRAQRGERLTWVMVGRRWGLLTDLGVEKSCKFVGNDTNQTPSKPTAALTDAPTAVITRVSESKQRVNGPDSCPSPPGWQWMDDSGKWLPYARLAAMVLEEAYKKGAKSTRIGVAGTRYAIDLVAMQQANPTTGRCRDVRRFVAPAIRSPPPILQKPKKKRRRVERGAVHKRLHDMISRCGIDPVRIVKQVLLGSGAFGQVHKAMLTSLNETSEDTKVVAVKSLHASNSAAVTAFVKEAEMLSRLHHRNIIQFFGVCCAESGPLAFVMEFAPETLKNRIDRRAGVATPPRETCALAVDIASGLAYLHSRAPPIIHRDLKPANILISANGEAKLADFGVSREERTTSLMTTCGTPAYMSPEVFTDSLYSTSADIYSLAMVLYAMETGRAPWSKCKNRFTLMKWVADGKRPPLPRAPVESGIGVTACRNALRELIRNCWHADPKQRPSSIVKVVKTLNSLTVLLPRKSSPEQRSVVGGKTSESAETPCAKLQ